MAMVQITDTFSAYPVSFADEVRTLKPETIDWLLFLKKKTGGLRGYGRRKLWSAIHLEYENQIVTDVDTNQEVTGRVNYWLEVDENLFQLINKTQKEYNELYGYA